MSANNYYQHKYGGLYRMITKCKHADTKEDMIVYEHMYPFDKQTYVRNQSEFFEKFKPITNDQYEQLLLLNKYEMQQLINNNKRNTIS